MTDKVQERYEQWLAERREVHPPANLADQIMSQVAELECERRVVGWQRLVRQIERSRVARWSVCSGALAVGALPFFFFIRVTRF